MNHIMLYHLWRRGDYQKFSNGKLYLITEDFDLPEDEDGAPYQPVGDVVVRYHLETSVTSLEEAQAACQASNGHLVYSFSECWYGEQG